MKYRIDIVIDLDDIQQAIYTEGAWHPAGNATAWGVNPSNEPLWTAACVKALTTCSPA